MLDSSSLKHVTPKKYSKIYNLYVNKKFFVAEHDPGVSLPLIVQEKTGKSKNPYN